MEQASSVTGTGELLEQEAPPSTPGLDWSQLPADLLIRIFGTLEIPDIFSSGVVCRSWHASYREARRLGICSNNPGPCLVFSSSDRDPSVATLHSLTTGKDYYVTMPDPPFRTRYIVGSSHGWLITADERSNLLLVNPATQAQIAMPPPKTIANVKIRCNGEGVPDGYDLFRMDMLSRDFDDETESIDISWEEGRFYFYTRVVLSADPSSGNCTVMILHLLDNLLSFARVGATHWTWINVNEPCWNYHDVLYNDDDRLFYAIRGNGDVHAIDTNGPSLMLRVVLDTKNSLIDCAKYIVLSESGDLLQVCRYYHYVNNKERRTRELLFYKVDLVEHKLVELKDFEGHALFIGFNSSFFLRIEDFPMLTPNSVYCTDDTMHYIFRSRFGFREVSAFHLEDSSFIDLLPIGSRLNWPPPVWFRPSFSKDRTSHISPERLYVYFWLDSIAQFLGEECVWFAEFKSTVRVFWFSIEEEFFFCMVSVYICISLDVRLLV